MSATCTSRGAVAVALAGVLLATGGSARAIELELPGERTLELHGFYELRLQFLGEDWPGNGTSMSQFRHVLDLETETELFPDGIGPFDFMMAYTRWIVQYECAYQGGCLIPGFKNARLFGSHNFYGGDAGHAVRAPRNLKPATTGDVFAGGIIEQRFAVPGTIRPVHQKLTSHQRIPIVENGMISTREIGRSGRFRGPINPPGILGNPDPLAAFANLNARSKLDSPVREFVNNFTKIRAASYNSSFHVNYLQFARTSLGESGFQLLSTKFGDGQFLSSVAQQATPISQTGLLRGLNTAILQLQRGELVTGSTTLDELIAERDALLFSDPSERTVESAMLDFFAIDPALLEAYGITSSEELEELNLIATRPDPNRYETLASATSPELLAAVFGSAHLGGDLVIPYLATIDTPIRPFGYFDTGGAPINIVSPYAAGMAGSLTRFAVKTLPPGAVQSADIGNRVAPAFFGPDGLLNSADDLPFSGQGGLVVADDVYGSWLIEDGATSLPQFDRLAQIPNARTGELAVDERNGKPLVLYGEVSDRVAALRGCFALGGTDSEFEALRDAFAGPVRCEIAGREAVTNQLRLIQLGCRDLTGRFQRGGVNADGHCIQLNVEQGTVSSGEFGGVHLRVIEALGRQTLRPVGADLEPPDLTDVLARGTFTVVEEDGGRTGRTPPARPRAPGNQLFFETAGLTRLVLSSRGLVSALDLDFDVNELRWGHGASDDEHEFREGYLEFELFDSSVWARVGKLLMVWGKTELFRNQDRLNPVDLSNGVITRLEEARVGQWAADVVFAPEVWMQVGPVEDLRLEFAVIFDDFEGQDLGRCGEASTLAVICSKAFGAYAHGITGVGLAGEVRPDEEYGGLASFDFGVRIEGRWNRFTFAVTDFWGWDDAFYIDPIHRYLRRVDPATGAPVNSTGPLRCRYRSADGGMTSDPSLSVGPDGRAETPNDNLIPTQGNCLLFDSVSDATAVQLLRANDLIAAGHSANQTLFHTLCTLTFDPDQGFCAFDRLTNPEQFKLVGLALSGSTNANLALLGMETLRLRGDPFAANFQPGSQILGPLVPGDDFRSTLAFSAEQGALLGCGPSFASACGTNDQNEVFRVDPGDDSVERALRISDVVADLPGGVDFMNADASVLTQDFTVLKATAQPLGAYRDGEVGASIRASDRSALIATRNRDFDALGNFAVLQDLRYEAGVTLGGLSQAQIAGDAPLAGGGFLSPELSARATAEALSGLPLSCALSGDDSPDCVDRARVIEDLIAEADASPAADGWIEPLPWALDEDALVRGEVLYRVADQTLRDPRCDPTGRARDDSGVPVFTADEVEYCGFRRPGWTAENSSAFLIRNDPSDPTNSANEFIEDYERIADVCHPFILGSPLTEDAAFMERFGGGQAFALDRGCTELERFSANLERFLMLLEVMGEDRHFDPPETVSEIFAMLDGDFSNDHFGDPISGPDGIFTRNARVFRTDRTDVQVVEGTGQVLVDMEEIDPDFDPERDSEAEFFEAFDSASCPATRCYLRVGTRIDPLGPLALPQLGRPLIAALPLSSSAQSREPGMEGTPVRFSPLWLANADDVDGDGIGQREGQLALSRLLAGDTVRINTLQRDASGQGIIMDVSLSPEERLKLMSETAANLDGDRTGIRDLDQDQDGVWDGADDFTPGPMSDDNILCGSGIPGDYLQNPMQHELYSDAEETLFREAFGGDGEEFPNRSPVYCAGVAGLLGATAQTLPMRRAAGDSTWGRRDFLWHGGQQLALRYQKRNVLGFALDFAEDRTKTSWGIEMSWLHDAWLANTRRFGGRSQHDVVVLSVSVDRPTFFNFLNPNRSFFLNFQFFMQYIFDYEGGPDDRDGNFGVAERAFSIPVATLTFFTGYFQDRLEPRATFIWSPETQTGGVLWGLSYRWTGNFSTGLAVNQFFGEAPSIHRSFFPTAQYGSNDILTTQLRGLAATGSEDSFYINLRYSW